jgi:hypothetical protein
MLTRSIIARCLIVCAALWCVAGIAASFVQGDPENVSAVTAVDLAGFQDRWVDVTFVPGQEPGAKADRLIAFLGREQVKAEPSPSRQQTGNAAPEKEIVSHQVDSVCGVRGRRWYGHRHRRWRCRR